MTEIDYRRNAERQDPADIQAMFNAIAPTYDTLNHLLSFGLDILWRRRAIKLLQEKRGGVILDIAAGSGDLSIDALSLQPRKIIATDFAVEMLNVLSQKLVKRNIPANQIELAACDALKLPFHDSSFDATMVAFGIRNFADRLQGMREMHRVLKSGGLALILELSKPRTIGISQLYALYTKFGLPTLGRMISSNNSAYRYLPESIATFPVETEFLSLMAQAGFREVNAKKLSFGTATIYVGRK